MVKFMCQLDWAMGHPVSQSDIILGVLVKVFLNEMNIWIGRLSKADCLPRWMRWASSNKLKIWIKWKGWVRGTSCPPSCWVETLDFSCLDLELTPAALLDPTWRLCLRLHDHASQLPIFSLCVCVSPMGSISRENPSTVLLFAGGKSEVRYRLFTEKSNIALDSSELPCSL